MARPCPPRVAVVAALRRRGCRAVKPRLGAVWRCAALWVPCHILVDVRAVKPRWGAVWRSPNVGGQWVPVGVQ